MNTDFDCSKIPIAIEEEMKYQLHGLRDERHRLPRAARCSRGLKPVHRRILLGMHGWGCNYNRPIANARTWSAKF